MTARLQSDESFTLGVRRLLLEAADRLVQETDVHEVRLACKQIRAWLRLLRDAMDEPTFQRENRAFRNIGRRFRASRDDKTLRDTIAGLKETAPYRIDDDMIGNLSGGILSERRVVTADDMDKVFARTRADAQAAKARIIHLALGKVDLRKAMKRSWRLNLLSRRRAGRETGSEKTAALHEWRKQAKYLRFQIEILRDAWPGALDHLDHGLNKLTDDLGDDHDLAVLEQALSDAQVQAGPARPVIAAERRRHQKKAWRRAKRLYDDKPEAFARAAASHWRQWRQ